nr:hypothetical protein CIT39_20600 [Bradyrhizobium symbiodeficiens]
MKDGLITPAPIALLERELDDLRACDADAFTQGRYGPGLVAGAPLADVRAFPSTQTASALGERFTFRNV